MGVCSLCSREISLLGGQNHSLRLAKNIPPANEGVKEAVKTAEERVEFLKAYLIRSHHEAGRKSYFFIDFSHPPALFFLLIGKEA